MATVVFITESYPFGGLGESGFIAPEIDFLASEFNRIIIAPVLDFGANETLPGNVEIDRSLLALPKFLDKFKSLFQPHTHKALRKDFSRIKTWTDLRSELAFSAYTLYYRDKILDLIEKHSLNLDETLFYTFWFDYATAGLSLIDGAKFITRAHGQDLYEEVLPFKSRYWREKSLSQVKRCYPVSYFASSYLKDKYPTYDTKIQHRYLGSPPPISVPTKSKEQNQRSISLFSCARVTKEKRVDYQYEVIKKYATFHPELNIEWLHIGDGPQMQRLKKSIASSPQNLKITLTGSLSNNEIHNILSQNYFDLSLLFSETEGFGLVIIEAQSYGIPCLATDTQAIPEAVGNAGFLLSHTATISEAAKALDYAVCESQGKRNTALIQWSENFNATILRKNFAKEIRQLLS